MKHDELHTGHIRLPPAEIRKVRVRFILVCCWRSFSHFLISSLVHPSDWKNPSNKE